MRLSRFYRRYRPLRRGVRRVKNSVVYTAVRAANGLLAPLSLEQALALADHIGDFVYFALPKTRRLALKHIDLALGDSFPATARRRIVRAAFRNMARCFCEVAKFDAIRAQLDDYVEVEGWEHLQAGLAEKQGVIAITGHVGNWELLAAYCALKGAPVAAIARRIYEPRINQLLVDFRLHNGVQTILRESPTASRDMLRVLRSGGILALLIDQDTRVPSVSVPFFGRMARTPAAAAALALRRELPVLPAFAQRRPGGGHRLTFLPLIRATRTGDRRRDVAALTGVFNQILEERIVKNPAEWVWWHRRWRHPPIPRLDLDCRVP
jgi:Kdo2-lipid IVA lauroyltransferase/acyltransferase